MVWRKLVCFRKGLPGLWGGSGADPQLPGEFHFLQLDLTLDLTPIFDWCPEVDVLCNTAGVLDDYKPLLEQSAQEIQEILRLTM